LPATPSRHGALAARLVRIRRASLPDSPRPVVQAPATLGRIPRPEVARTLGNILRTSENERGLTGARGPELRGGEARRAKRAELRPHVICAPACFVQRSISALCSLCRGASCSPALRVRPCRWGKGTQNEAGLREVQRFCDGRDILGRGIRGFM